MSGVLARGGAAPAGGEREPAVGRSPQAIGNPDQVSLKKFKSYGLGQNTHKERVAKAIRRRLGGSDYPSTVKQLAGLIGVTAQAAHNWVNGVCDPSSYCMGELVRTFGTSFLFEVYGQGIVAFERGSSSGSERAATAKAASREVQGQSLAPAPLHRRA